MNQTMTLVSLRGDVVFRKMKQSRGHPRWITARKMIMMIGGQGWSDADRVVDADNDWSYYCDEFIPGEDDSEDF